MRRFVVYAALCVAWTTPAMAQDRVIPTRLTLDEALRLAAERNPSYAAARTLVSAAEASRLEAKQRPNPAFTVDSVGRPIGQSTPVGLLDDHEYVFRVDQEVETAGRRRLRGQIAEAGVDVARAEADDARRRLDLDVRRAYFQAVLAEADRGVAEATLKEIDDVITLNRARFATGEISGADLRRVQVERLRFVDDLFAAELALRNARSALLALLNAPRLDEDFDTVEPLAGPSGQGAALVAATLPPSLLDPGAALEQARTGRADVRAAQSDQQRADTQTRLQRALRTPNPTVGGGYSHLGGLNTVAFSATVPLPLFNRNQGAVARADAERIAAAQRSAAASTQAALDVQQAQNALGLNRARVDYIEREYLGNAQQSRDVVLASYRLGSATLIDFLDAQRAYRDTVRTYNRALFDLRLSIFQLQAAVGEPVASR